MLGDRFFIYATTMFYGIEKRVEGRVRHLQSEGLRKIMSEEEGIFH